MELLRYVSQPSVCNPKVFHTFSPLELSFVPGVSRPLRHLNQQQLAAPHQNACSACRCHPKQMKALDFKFLESGTYIHEVDKDQSPTSCAAVFEGLWHVLRCLFTNIALHLCRGAVPILV